MSFERSPPLVDLPLGASRSLAALCALAHALAIAASWASGLPRIAAAALTIALAAHGLWWIASQGLRILPSSLRRFVWQPDGECILVQRRSRNWSGRVLPGHLASSALTVIRVGAGRERRVIVVARDAVDAEAFRRLRVRLNLAPPPVRPPLLRRCIGRARSLLREGPSEA
ncbi:MAG TPA: protein YgfX [Gammaproteobacteria bacterium]|nr:protein YgfX [Gammaproteobacteria bacterium]